MSRNRSAAPRPASSRAAVAVGSILISAAALGIPVLLGLWRPWAGITAAAVSAASLLTAACVRTSRKKAKQPPVTYRPGEVPMLFLFMHGFAPQYGAPQLQTALHILFNGAVTLPPELISRQAEQFNRSPHAPHGQQPNITADYTEAVLQASPYAAPYTASACAEVLVPLINSVMAARALPAVPLTVQQLTADNDGTHAATLNAAHRALALQGYELVSLHAHGSYLTVLPADAFAQITVEPM